MRKKALILGAVLALSAMTFVGCGNKDANNSATDQETNIPGTTDNNGAGDNGGVVDDLEDGAKDVGDAVGDAVDDAGNALDGDTTDNGTKR